MLFQAISLFREPFESGFIANLGKFLMIVRVHSIAQYHMWGVVDDFLIFDCLSYFCYLNFIVLSQYLIKYYRIMFYYMNCD